MSKLCFLGTLVQKSSTKNAVYFIHRCCQIDDQTVAIHEPDGPGSMCEQLVHTAYNDVTSLHLVHQEGTSRDVQMGLLA